MRYYEAIRKPKGTSSVESYKSSSGEHIETVIDGIKPQAMGKKVALVLNDAFTEGSRQSYDKLYPELERLREENIKYISVIEAYKAQHEVDKIEKNKLKEMIEDLNTRLEYHRSA